jgi:hypothetical protein
MWYTSSATCSWHPQRAMIRWNQRWAFWKWNTSTQLNGVSAYFWWPPVLHTSKTLWRMMLLAGSSTSMANTFSISFTDRQHWTPYNSPYLNRKKHCYKSRKELPNSIPHGLERDHAQQLIPPWYACHRWSPHHRRTHCPRSHHSSSTDAAWYTWPIGTIQGMFWRLCQCACGRSSHCSAHTCTTHQGISDGGRGIPSHFVDWYDWTCKVTIYILVIRRIIHVTHTVTNIPMELN